MKTFGKSFDSNAGDFTLKPTPQGKLRTFLYTPRSGGVTELRAVCPSDENGNPVPQIEAGATDLSGISDMFIQCDYIRFLGSLKYHMLCPVHPRLDDSIVGYFYRAISTFVKEHRRTAPGRFFNWLGMADEGQKQAPRATLKSPSSHLFVQGYLIRHEGKYLQKDGKKKPLFPVVLALSSSARKAAIADLLTPADPDAEISAANSKLGDVSSLEGNTILVEAYEDPEAKGFSKTRYRVTAGKQAKINQKQNAIYQPWEELLNLDEDAATVIGRLADTFDAEAVNFAFGSSPLADEIPDHVRNAETAKTKTKPAAKKKAAPKAPPASVEEPMEGIDDLLDTDDGPADLPFEPDGDDASPTAGLDYDMADLEKQLEEASGREADD